MSSMSILIVEDELLLQDVYKLVLSVKGYTVHTASNGKEGLVQLKQHTPDVVLLDIFMPVMDGKEFLRQTDTAEYPDTTFIVYSNLSDVNIEADMLALGADKVILKSSLAPKDLIALVSEYEVTG